MIRPAAAGAAILAAGVACAPPDHADLPEPPGVALSLALEPTTGAIGWRSPVVESTDAAAWADVDGDGALDLALGLGEGKFGGYPALLQMGLYRNIGRDFASSVVPVQDPLDIGALAWGDADDDGDPDLLVGAHLWWPNGIGNELAADGLTLLRNSRGRLEPAWTSFPRDAHRTTDLAWADVDADGDLDFAEASVEGLWLWRASGGTFLPEPISDTPCRAVAWVDRNGDGLPELTAAGESGLLILPNTRGTPVLDGRQIVAEGEASWDVTWGDWLGDGRQHPALAAADRVRVYRDAGDGFFQRLSHPRIDAEPRAVEWADFDADGDLDLAVGWTDGAVEVLAGFESFTGQVLESEWQSVGRAQDVVELTAADWDGDGDPDLLAGRLSLFDDLDESITAVYESVSGSPKRLDSSVGLPVTAAAGADWDGDGDEEIVVAYQVREELGQGHAAIAVIRGGPDGGLVVAPDNPRFEFPEATPESPGIEVRGLFALDWDQDPDVEVALATSVGLVILEPGDGGYTAAYFEPGATPSTDVAAADADSDGDLDVAVVGGGSLRLLRNDGGVLRVAWSEDIGEGAHDAFPHVAWAHLDGDGRQQLVLVEPGAVQPLTVFEAGPLTGQAWSRRTLTGAPRDALVVRAADIDLDGVDELYVGTRSADRLIEVEGSEATTLWESRFADPTSSVAIADFDGDGTLDLAAATAGFARLYQYREGDWVPILDTEFDPDTPGVPRPLFFDVDGDADLDLLTIGTGGWSIDLNGRGGSDLHPFNESRLRLRWDSIAPAVPPSGRGGALRQEDGPMEVVLTVFDAESDPVRGVRFEFRDWSGGWRPATVEGVPEVLESAPRADGGVELRATWKWVDDGSDGEDVQLRAVLDTQRSWGGEQHFGRTAAVTAAARVYLDSDGDGVRDTTDPCPFDPGDRSLVPGACDSEALAAGWWCAASGAEPRSAAWLLLAGSGYLWRRRRVSGRAEA